MLSVTPLWTPYSLLHTGRRGKLTYHQAWDELAHRWTLAGNWRGLDPTRDEACTGGPLASAQAADQQDARLNYGGARQSIAIASCLFCLTPTYRLTAFSTKSSESEMTPEHRCCFLQKLPQLGAVVYKNTWYYVDRRVFWKVSYSKFYWKYSQINAGSLCHINILL